MILRLICGLFACVGLSISLGAQAKYASPIHYPIKLSGTYNELRPNHFHAGIDLKSSRGLEGDSIFAIADGYVYRIKRDKAGYGQSLYLRHTDDSIMSVYAHIQRFRRDMTDSLVRRAVAEEDYEPDIFFDPEALPVRRGEFLGFMGNTGHSFGPHLHLEVRSWSGETSYNPLAYLGHFVSDGKPPVIKAIQLSYLSPSGEAYPQGIRYLGKEMSDGDTVLCGAERVGLSFLVHDKQEGTHNNNGIYAFDLFVADTLAHSFRMDSMHFPIYRHSNAHLDYKSYWKHRISMHQCFMDRENLLPIYNKISKGIKISKSRATSIRVVVGDYFGNSQTFVMHLKYMDGWTPPSQVYNYHIPPSVESRIVNNGFELSIPPTALGRHVRPYISHADDMINDQNAPSLYINLCEEPLFSPVQIKYYLPKDVKMNWDKWHLAQKCDDKEYSPLVSTLDTVGHTLTAQCWHLGVFTVQSDTIAPKIFDLVEEKGNIFGRYSVTVKDDKWGFSDLEVSLRSGGAFHPAYLDAKKKKIFFDHREKGTEVLIRVADPLGNSSELKLVK